jgi:hypothetical protein
MPQLRYVEPALHEDFAYLECAESLIKGVVRSIKPNRFFVVKIDNWFGKRWLRFSGKAFGAIGVGKARLTLPPFIPSRVVSQSLYSRKGTHPGRHPRLHPYQRSGENLQRYMDVVVEDSSVFWYSGRSAKNDRASLMAYIWTPEGHWPWYVGLQRAQTWRVVESIGISAQELDAFSRPGGSNRPSPPGGLRTQ